MGRSATASGGASRRLTAIRRRPSGSGRFETALARLRILVEIVRRPDFAKGFVLLPKRWRVEHAFGAGRCCRRLLVDHETLPQVSEAMIRLGSIMRFVHALTA